MDNETNSTAELSLLDIENQNVDSSLELFEIIKETAEEYCKYARKYKECTSNYLEKLSNIKFTINKKEIKSKNIKISPIYSIIKKVPKLIEQQNEGLKKFVNSFDCTIKPLEDCLKTELNSSENSKKEFEDKKKQYQKNRAKHKKLMDALSSTEKNVVKYYMSKREKLDEKEMKSTKDNMNASLNDAKNIEKEFLGMIKEEKNYHWLFQQTSFENIDYIKNRIRTILQNLSNNIIFFLYFFNEFYTPSVKYIQEEIKKNINIQDLMNEIIKLKVFKPEEFPEDKYNIKILEKAKVETLSYSIESIDTKEISKSSTFSFFKPKTSLMKDEDIISKINKMEMLEIVKEFYNNFKMVNKSHYNVDAEEEKIKVKTLSDKLLLMNKYKNKKKKKNDEKEEDIITEEEKQELLSLINKRDNRIIFLSRLNKVRTFGKFEFIKSQFDDVINILTLMLDQILTEKDYYSFNFCMILTQTFYHNENGEKIYIYKKVKSHKIFQSEEMWRNTIEYGIKEEEKKYDDLMKNLSIKKNLKKINEMIFAQLLSITNNMIEFDLDINVAEKIILDSFKNHKTSEESTKIILNIIDEKKNKINKNEETNKEKENKKKEMKENNVDKQEEKENKKENIESEKKEEQNKIENKKEETKENNVNKKETKEIENKKENIESKNKEDQIKNGKEKTEK